MSGEAPIDLTAAEVRDLLLPHTLEYAVGHSPFYARRFGEAWKDVAKVSDLANLPLLTKADAYRHQQQMRCGEGSHDLGRVSSGTTREKGELFWVQRSSQEYAMLNAHDDDSGQDSASTSTHDPNRPLVLSVVSANHGYPNPPVKNVIQLVSSPYLEVGELIERTLATAHDGQHVTVMNISLSALKELTAQLLQRRVDFDRFHLTHIGTNSGLVTSRWRERLESIWSAKVVDNYSLSEFRTPATECLGCGWYHFGLPPVAVEILDPMSGEAVTRGFGELVLTSLYPYVQRQPLIRYATGDIVEIGPPCPRVDDWSIRFCGRKHQTPHIALEGQTRYLLFPPLLEDVADDHAMCRRGPSMLEHSMPGPDYQTGQVFHGIEYDASSGRLTARVGIRFERLFFPEAAKQLETALAQELMQRQPGLADLVQEGEVHLHVDLVSPTDEEPTWIYKSAT